MDFIDEAKSYLFRYFKINIADKSVSLNEVYPLEITQELTDLCDIEESNIHDFLGRLYENTIPKDVKKDLGQFYTRDKDVIESMIEETNNFKGKILEPSCGSGLFIMFTNSWTQNPENKINYTHE